ncbi:hypothetical protein Sjap_020571 [Stephania japonica]|uniref:Uncharacterized protein n=1 Tax=Stephania japonica TaxID=461633 RepID=A0AAP0HZ44_9MAGN
MGFHGGLKIRVYETALVVNIECRSALREREIAEITDIPCLCSGAAAAYSISYVLNASTSTTKALKRNVNCGGDHGLTLRVLQKGQTWEGLVLFKSKLILAEFRCSIESHSVHYYHP